VLTQTNGQLKTLQTGFMLTHKASLEGFKLTICFIHCLLPLYYVHLSYKLSTKGQIIVKHDYYSKSSSNYITLQFNPTCVYIVVWQCHHHCFPSLCTMGFFKFRFTIPSEIQHGNPGHNIKVHINFYCKT
jgi:hypothetical protein